ncbi:MAG: 4-(cytidine 5'-diphospho)-2-C-methyl-D-erythritol kinase [Spirochaetaceae bacterium]|jgi:4-diphosphocytidyl-2-C-methyl-D-erythritol kinase|nr:4-(cytidine 5'-diphospho)-2-C-methyl-D-erythritol kinase [Spirochaetaceae bacterium]
MPFELCVSAPAKLNIGLRVLRRGADGYHGIESVFQTIPLCDTLSIRRAQTGIGRCVVECASLALPPDNTIARAHGAFCTLTGVQADVEVVLEKRIPAGAGLGGGSSDAAAMIRALDALFGTGLSPKDMAHVAGQAGSDVFFFLACAADGRGAAVVTGRGDQVSLIPARSDLWFVLVYPDVPSSTPAAYRLLDKDRSEALMRQPVGSGVSPGEIVDLAAAYFAPVADWSFVNDFTEPVTRVYPRIAQAIRDVEQTGALYTAMTGSGSGVFGVFCSRDDAKRAGLRLGGAWNRCWVLEAP